MGAYLSKPVIDKEFEHGEDDFLSFVTCSMQGWRTSQEDSHNCIIDFNEHMSLFAVYDGHGGAEVAQLCSEKLPTVIKGCDQFNSGNYNEALVESFLTFDESILSSEIQETLKKLANIDDNKSNDEDEEEDDPNLLQEEATLPLSQLLRKYQLSMMDNGSEDEEDTSKNITEEKDKAVEESTTSKITSSDGESDQLKKIQEASDDTVEDEEDEEFVMGEEDEEDEDDDEDDEDADTEENEEGSGDENGCESIASSLQDFQYMHSAPGFDSGSTAVVAIVDKKSMKVYVANAGDSRCVLCRNGLAVDLSLDHKPEDEIENQRITAAGGVLSEDGRVNGGLNLSRSIGDHSYKRNKELALKDQMISALPDIKTVDILPQQDEFLVLACDGIWNTFSSQELVDFIKKRLATTDLKDLLSEIFAHCLAPNTSGDGTGCDNMTCIIVSFKNGGQVPPVTVNSGSLCNGSAIKRKLPEDTDNNDGGDNDLPSKIIKIQN